jgi:uncharacterized protein YqjF (DUF2071 family)
MEESGTIDRLAMRARPEGSPVMHQRWENLLFLHWAIDPVLLRPLLPNALDIDLFDGKAWIGITPFHLENVRLAMLPAFPGFSSFDELNVRTYVLHKGTPGVWFFSLDASKLMPMVAARIFFMLPYYKASGELKKEQNRLEFHLKRTGPPSAAFHARWQSGPRLRDPDVHSLAFFLVERYCLFSVDGRRLYQTRIYHHPWILDEAFVDDHSSTMLSALGLPEPVADPLVHCCNELDCDFWAPAEIGETIPATSSRIPVH